MSTNREGGYIPSEAERKGTRPSLLVWIQESRAVVGMEPAKLGCQRDRGLRASRAFAQELNRLSHIVADKEPQGSEDQERLQDSLRLSKEISVRALLELRRIGAGLRADLSDEMVGKFRFNDFLKEQDQEGPALTFLEEQNAPIQWEMMYEGQQVNLPEWKHFWGFQVPITHWVQKSRTDEIRLRTGLFSAIHEDLGFAGREVAQLTEKRGLPHRTLNDAFRELVDHEVQNKMQGDQNKVAAWWQACQTGPWLRLFINELVADATLPDIEADSWKRKSLVQILNSGLRCDMIHFACHCKASEKTEFLSRLDMKVAGELICLDVSLMASDLRRELGSAHDPGSLVFLNACGTGRQSASHEPPGFPEKWINNQGALAVVATLCPVPDYFAHAFALKFYEILLAGVENPQDPGLTRHRFVAEALMATRRHFMEKYDNPLGLAYVLYAVNGVHVLADFRGPEGAHV